MRNLMIIVFALLLIIPVTAQDSDLMAERVELEATDGLMLVADYYLPEMMDEIVPALLLMHMNGGRRSDYLPLIPSLLEQGYAVLTVDLRAHGETGGDRDWDAAIVDTQVWFDWLREQDVVDDSRVAVIGASIGSNLALIGCDNDPDCVTAIALSPGDSYFGVQPGDSLVNGVNAFLVASHGDSQSARSIREFFNNATGFVSTRMYPGRAHGTSLFNSELESITSAILAWLAEQFRAVESA